MRWLTLRWSCHRFVWNSEVGTSRLNIEFGTFKTCKPLTHCNALKYLNHSKDLDIKDCSNIWICETYSFSLSLKILHRRENHLLSNLRICWEGIFDHHYCDCYGLAKNWYQNGECVKNWHWCPTSSIIHHSSFIIHHSSFIIHHSHDHHWNDHWTLSSWFKGFWSSLMWFRWYSTLPRSQVALKFELPKNQVAQ